MDGLLMKAPRLTHVLWGKWGESGLGYLMIMSMIGGSEDMPAWVQFSTRTPEYSYIDQHDRPLQGKAF